MAKFRVYWSEKHCAEIEADTEEIAVEEVVFPGGCETLIRQTLEKVEQLEYHPERDGFTENKAMIERGFNAK